MNIQDYSSRYNEFTSSVMRRMVAEAEKENEVMSPLSILLLLGIAAESTAGRTREEIVNLIGPDCSYEELIDVMRSLQKDFSSDKSFISSNAVCIKESIAKSVNPSYEGRLAEFGGKLFASKDMVRAVNKWVKEKTRGMITDIADESMRRMMACLLNAVAFEAAWEDPYEDSDVREGVFHNADGTKTTVQMLNSMENNYIENDWFTGFTRPYAGFNYSFMGLLPKKRGKMFLAKGLEDIDLTELYRSASHDRVSVTMPEFEYDYGIELTEMCKELGIETIFTSEADFSPMSSEWLMVDSILHKAHIELDRKGTKAAAVTMAVVCCGCAMPMEEPKVVRLNRPFVYAIVNNETGLPVFTGMVNKII